MTNYQFGHRINILGHLFSKELNRRIERSGITSSQWSIVVRLLLHDELTQSEIKEQLFVEASTVSQAINRMEQMGWIVRIVHDIDKREKKVRLTDKAKQQLSLWLDETTTLEHQALEDISEEEIVVFDRVLQRITDNLKRSGIHE